MENIAHIFKPLRNGSKLYSLIPRMSHVILSSSLLGDALRWVGNMKLANDRGRIGGSWVAMMSEHPRAHAPDGRLRGFPLQLLQLQRLIRAVISAPRQCVTELGYLSSRS